MVECKSPRWRCYNVTVEGFSSFVVSAPSRSAAMYECWTRYRESYDITFLDFMRATKIHVVPSPKDDGYDYVRRTYGVFPTIGQRVRLRNEGASSGQEGVVIYPGSSTAYVKVALDGRKHPCVVHPDNVELLAHG